MTDIETAKLIHILATNYASQSNKLSQDTIDDLIRLWTIQFSDVPYLVMEQAVNVYIQSHSFFPNISDMRTILHDLIYQAQSKIYKHLEYFFFSKDNALKGYVTKDNVLPKKELELNKALIQLGAKNVYIENDTSLQSMCNNLIGMLNEAKKIYLADRNRDRKEIENKTKNVKQ